MYKLCPLQLLHVVLSNHRSLVLKTFELLSFYFNTNGIFKRTSTITEHRLSKNPFIAACRNGVFGKLVILECAICGNNNFNSLVLSCISYTNDNCLFQHDILKCVDGK